MPDVVNYALEEQVPKLERVEGNVPEPLCRAECIRLINFKLPVACCGDGEWLFMARIGYSEPSLLSHYVVLIW